MSVKTIKALLFFFASFLTVNADAQGPRPAPLNLPDSAEVDYEIKNFPFQSGETTLPVLRLHYTTFGHPVKDNNGKVTNAIYIMHGTTGDSHSLVNQLFAGRAMHDIDRVGHFA